MSPDIAWISGARTQWTTKAGGCLLSPPPSIFTSSPSPVAFPNPSLPLPWMLALGGEKLG